MKTETRREFLKKSFIFGAGLSFPHAFSLSKIDAAGSRPPNIIFVLADDMGWGDLPCYGHEGLIAHGGWTVLGDLRMPNFDRMAREGTRFTQYYVPCAVCSPSRTGIMTGIFPSELGIHDYLATPELNRERGMPDFVDPSIPTIPALLRKAGYRTAHFGKWHLGSGKKSPPPEEYGIDTFKTCLDGPGKRVGSTGMIVDEAVAFAESNRDDPFFVNLWLYDPHSPLLPTPDMLKEYKELSPQWGDNYGALQVWYSVLTNMDRHIGRLLDRMDALDLSNNTIVIFSSDNGPEIGTIPFTSHYGEAAQAGPFRGMKRSLYEGGIRMPFIVRWRGKTPAGAVNNESVLNGVDLLPTFCRLAGLEPPDDGRRDGEELSALFSGGRKERTRAMLWENRFPVYGHVMHRSPMLAIREGNYKLLMNPDGDRVELYDIPADPLEVNNLVYRYPHVVKELAQRALAWQKTLPPGPVGPEAGKNDYPWPK